MLKSSFGDKCDNCCLLVKKREASFVILTNDQIQCVSPTCFQPVIKWVNTSFLMIVWPKRNKPFCLSPLNLLDSELFLLCFILPYYLYTPTQWSVVVFSRGKDLSWGHTTKTHVWSIGLRTITDHCVVVYLICWSYEVIITKWYDCRRMGII